MPEDDKKPVNGRKPVTAKELLAAQSTPYFVTTPRASSERSEGERIGMAPLEHVKGYSGEASPEALRMVNYYRQGAGEIIGRTLGMYGINAASAFGQSIADTWDMIGHYHSIKSEFTGEMDNYDSGLMGTSVRDMKAWAERLSQNMQIYEKNPGSVALTDPGWWGNQLASGGTSLGMAVAAAAEAAGIEWATGGLGTEAAIGKLMGVFGKIGKIRSVATAAETAAEAFHAAKGMRSMATIWGTVNGIAEGRMESQDSFDSIVRELTAEVDGVTGKRKYSDEEIQEAASKGAKTTFHYNLAMIPLNILTMRAMIFNPISGAAEGWLERGLGKLAGKFGKGAIGKGAGWAATHSVGLLGEGIEEGYQNFGSDEGMHRAKVMVGEEEENDIIERAGKELSSPEFWNSFAGGLIGGPATGGVMNLLSHSVSWRRKREMKEMYKDYISKIGKMDDTFATLTRAMDERGEHEEASNRRKIMNRDQVISNMYLDEQTGKTDLMDGWVNFIQGTLGELNNGKSKALESLGFNIDGKADLAKIKNEFEDYLKDATKLRTIFDEVKYQYHRGAATQVTRLRFNIDNLAGTLPEINANAAKARAGIVDYENLSENGKLIHDTDYELEALRYSNLMLAEKLKKNKNDYERKNIIATIKTNDKRMLEIDAERDRTQNLSKEEYTDAVRDNDNDILLSLQSAKSKALLKAP
jgi:hypothetical protein